MKMCKERLATLCHMGSTSVTGEAQSELGSSHLSSLWHHALPNSPEHAGRQLLEVRLFEAPLHIDRVERRRDRLVLTWSESVERIL